VTESRLAIQDVEKHAESSETEITQANIPYYLLNHLSKQLYTYTQRENKKRKQIYNRELYSS